MSTSMTVLAPLSKPEAALFWAAPAPTDSEFSPEDPLALDYLGQQMGLRLLPRLTTRTSRAQYYAVVLYGLHLGELAIAEYGLSGDDGTRKQLFERWEKFWALSVLESRDGALERGDPDAMRGIRGAKRAWRPGPSKLDLGYMLISRQLELGGLGAYLSSLRATGLVIDGTLRPSVIARDIIDAFWDDVRERDHRRRYESYALQVLDQTRSQIERKHGNLTLGRLGECARLTAIRKRPEQQARLFERLLGSGADGNTRVITQLVQRAYSAGITAARELLDAAIAGQLGALPGPLVSLLRGARALGDATVELLDYFNRVYRLVYRSGIPLRADVARETLRDQHRTRLQAVCQAMTEEPEALALRTLPAHGNAFVHLVSQLVHLGPDDALDALLAYHGKVQRERRGGNGWIVEEGDRLLLGLSNYQQHEADVRFPDFKLGVVRSLLHDLGQIQSPMEVAV
jgi:hypothetical protein